MLLALLAMVGYCTGILVLLLAGLTLLFQVAGQRAETVAYWGVMAVLTALFLYLKLLYLRYDAPHAMGDSFSYALTGEYPLTSMQFWAGLRPFTIPLAAKLLGINTQNYLMNEQLGRFAYLQTFFSALSWAVLAFTCAQITRPRSISLVLFGVILSFSLSLQVSLWDALLLSESLSFSLLAIILAGWLYLLAGLPTAPSGWIRWPIVFLTILATVLYAFGRDSNVYYVLAATAVMLFFWLSDRKLQPYKACFLIYAGAVLLIFVAQWLSLSFGNRWQVFMYDQLGMRILLDSQATQFFEAEGLPINDTLMTIPSMRGSKYQALINTSPDLTFVKSWVNCCSKEAYLKYLLSNPLRTFSEPLKHLPSLVNGSLGGYRNPRNGVIPLPRLLDNLSEFYFSREQWTAVVFALLIAAGLGIHLFRQDASLWIWIAAIALPVVPMIYLIWFGEPMEIDRHAAQISLQLHLAAWISIPLLAEKAIRWLSARIYQSSGPN